MTSKRLYQPFWPSLFFLISCVLCYSHFRDLIPNGYNVIDPCKTRATWMGVGHEHPDGGGALNPFGKDFYKFGKIWNEILCRADSDRDGRTNGEELGDPQCKWSTSNKSFLTNETSHPGICGPLETLECKTLNSWLQCETELRCEALKASDIQNFTLRLPQTRVPPEETTYICMIFTVPSNGVYDIIAGIPFVNNTDVLHHMLIYGCEEFSSEKDIPSSPFACGMGSRNKECRHLVAAWALGSNGFCLPDPTGIRIGTNRSRRLMVQLHWTNLQKKPDYLDSSGMTFFYTSKLRTNDMGMLSVGQMYLEIPPGGKTVSFTGGCTSFCSKKYMTGPLMITAAFNHMHYLGRSQEISVIRDGITVHTITNESNYDYDKQKIFWMKEPIEILPGDQISTTCTFQSKVDSNKTIYFGEGTADEMCFGFLLFYPKKHLPDGSSCQSWKSVPMCKVKNMRDKNEGNIIDECDVSAFSSNISLRKMANILQNCSNVCSKEIQTIIRHPCLKNDIGDYMRQKGISNITDGQLLLKTIETCSHVGNQTCELLESATAIIQAYKMFLIISVAISSVFLMLA
ncbi:hypothetical protein ACJMK2_016175 [Sinanodonta woodiana]|uniref:Uncharacterized protein n=1 Tax=Sinanodonta woodiana TaxID=1069815 RepID=A0ABD3UU55_SINWO